MPTKTETKISRSHALHLAADAAHEVLSLHLSPGDSELKVATDRVMSTYRDWRREVEGR